MWIDDIKYTRFLHRIKKEKIIFIERVLGGKEDYYPSSIPTLPVLVRLVLTEPGKTKSR